MGDNFEHVISPHGPSMVKHSTATVGIMHFLAIGKDQPLPRRNTPHKSHVMFFSTTRGSRLTSGQSVGIGKAESPAKKSKAMRQRALTNNTISVNFVQSLTIEHDVWCLQCVSRWPQR